MILMAENIMELSQTKLKDKIRELINQVTCSKYIGELDLIIETECNCSYFILKLGLNCKDASPISFGYQGDEEGFLNYLKKEFRKRKLQNLQYTQSKLINSDSNNYYPIIEL